MDFENTSAEMQEVAEPAETEEVTETGVEEQEAADPVSEEHQKTDADSAFAEMRRAKEAAEKEAEDARAELAEIQARQEARESTFSRLAGREEDAEILALAELTGMSEDEIRAEMQAANEAAQKDLRIQQLEEQINSSEAERLMQEDLRRIQRIDPLVNSLDELGPEYERYMRAFDEDGNPVMTPEDAYWAIRGKQKANQATPPREVGKVATGTAKKQGFTQAEIDAMSSDQLRANWKEIYNSWG